MDTSLGDPGETDGWKNCDTGHASGARPNEVCIRSELLATISSIAWNGMPLFIFSIQKDRFPSFGNIHWVLINNRNCVKLEKKAQKKETRFTSLDFQSWPRKLIHQLCKQL